MNKARNTLASGFLRDYPTLDKRPDDSIMFIDDDIGWEARAVLEFANRPEDIICGVYPKKSDELQFPVEMLLHNGAPVEHEGLYEVALAATGFMCVKRHVLERCAEESGQYPEKTTAGEVWCWDLFRTGFIPNEEGGKIGRWWGEDFFFSFMCRHLGFRIWIDPNLNFTHAGRKTWSGNFLPTLRAWEQETKQKNIELNLAAD